MKSLFIQKSHIFKKTNREILSKFFCSDQKTKNQNLKSLQQKPLDLIFKKIDDVTNHYNHNIFQTSEVVQSIETIALISCEKVKNYKNHDLISDLTSHLIFNINSLISRNDMQNLLLIFKIMINAKLSIFEPFHIILKKFTQKVLIDSYDLSADFFENWLIVFDQNFFQYKLDIENTNFKRKKADLDILIENYLIMLLYKITNNYRYINDHCFSILYSILHALNGSFSIKLIKAIKDQSINSSFTSLILDRLHRPSINAKDLLKNLSLLSILVNNSFINFDQPNFPITKQIIKNLPKLSLEKKSQVFNILCDIYKNSCMFNLEVINEIAFTFINQNSPKFSHLANLLVAIVFSGFNDNSTVHSILVKIIDISSDFDIFYKNENETILLEFHIALNHLHCNHFHKEFIDKEFNTILQKLRLFCVSNQMQIKPSKIKFEDLQCEQFNLNWELIRGFRFSANRQEESFKKHKQYSLSLDVIGKWLKDKLSESYNVRVYTNVRFCQFDIQILIIFEEMNFKVAIDFPHTNAFFQPVCKQKSVKFARLNACQIYVIEIKELVESLHKLIDEDLYKVAEILFDYIKKDKKIQEVFESKSDCQQKSSITV